MDVTPALKSYAQQKANKLEKYFNLLREIEVIFDAGKSSVVVEMIARDQHQGRFIARQANADDAYAGVDLCMAKLERQLSDHHKKLRNRKHPGT